MQIFMTRHITALTAVFSDVQHLVSRSLPDWKLQLLSGGRSLQDYLKQVMA